MKVLVAGVPKSGTKTMAAALTLLGYEVYDWMENFYYLGDDWQKQVREGFRMEDIRRMYENVDAVTDCPCDRYWEEIYDAFPDVKVILSTRDEQRWLQSLKKQVDELNNDMWYRLARTITYIGIKCQYHFALTGDHFAKVRTWPFTNAVVRQDEVLLRLKRRHERNVKLIVPKKQLLVYEVKEEWEPLCDFLGVPVPDKPFPHKNKGSALVDEFRKENAVMHRIESELKTSLFCLFAVFAFLFYKIYQSCG